jgi:translation initiation factor IF-3
VCSSDLSLAEEVVVEQFPRMEGRQMVMLVSPKRA